MELDPKDLQIDVYSSEVQVPRTVKVTHRPTGVVAEATDTSQLRAREAALEDLQHRVFLSTCCPECGRPYDR